MKNAKAGLFLILSQVGYGLFSLVWIIVALASFMMFDSPAALSDLRTMCIFIFLWLYPVGFLGSMIASWVLYHKRKFRKAVWIDLIPLLWVLTIAGFMVFA
ncbi:hypothetical protein RB620_29405 [Paenibacillus sp. LHD-117]|uniref:hypothetical protein n=1 Tax=Paenibacillus sp. LHD-117 TaxID=3071412 RepID=UPI0027E08700|nr:hypothetical protein [Paenibacillus sp. LHD-117]MDQ6423533.1 hypothetical protein [Paenibacillus sp. LHD-117]